MCIYICMCIYVYYKKLAHVMMGAKFQNLQVASWRSISGTKYVASRCFTLGPMK